MDAKEIERCIDEFGTDIYKFCRKLCLDQTEAEDLYQQTFLKAVESSQTLDWEQNPKALFFALAHNLWKSDRRKQARRNLIAPCGHRISLRAKYCEECGKQIEEKEDPFAMRTQKMHHIHYIIAAVVSLVLMLGCTAGFVVSVAAGNGINADVTSDERVWNTGFIIMDSSGWKNGIWKLKFKSASDGFIKEQVMKIEDAENQALYADISCGTVPEGAALILWLVQDDVAEAVDVTNLSEPLEYPLNMFENGKIRVRLQINGVEDTVSEISIH